jgi:hypothetical protein
MGWDFTMFYVASHLPAGQLYNRTAYLETAERLLGGSEVKYFPPYIRLAIFALPLRPLGWFSYKNAFLIWTAIQFGCYLASLFLLRSIYPFPPEALLGWALFYPSMHGIWQGHDESALLLLVVVAFFLLKSGREKLAGVLFALCAYKFNLFVLIPLYLLIRRQWQALGYGIGTTAILVGVSFSLQSPRTYFDYLKRVPEMSINFDPASITSLRGLTLGHPWLYGVTVVAVVLLALWAISVTDETSGFAIAITGSLLIAYYTFYYDLTLLAIPIMVILAKGGRWSRIAPLTLLVGVPLWFGPPRYMAILVVALLGGLVCLAPSGPDAKESS